MLQILCCHSGRIACSGTMLLVTYHCSPLFYIFMSSASFQLNKTEWIDEKEGNLNFIGIMFHLYFIVIVMLLNSLCRINILCSYVCSVMCTVYFRLLWRKRCAVGIWPNMSAEWLRWERQRENVNVLELSNANRGEQERGINEEDGLLVAVQRNNSVIGRTFHWEIDWIVKWRVSCMMQVPAIGSEERCAARSTVAISQLDTIPLAYLEL